MIKYDRKAEIQGALNKYSVAVAFADQGKPDYSLALANRWFFTIYIGIIITMII